ncbi:MAG: T9SS type A sorting domain-containing protein [Flavobacteriales bacterium]|nr:T9SS type A sorting domain-containing protein [Flavobacteriales bacterium]
MKRITLSLLLAIPYLAHAQNFTPELEHYFGVAPTDLISIHKVWITNELSPDTLHLSWKRVDDDYPAEWEVNLCDFGACYGDLPGSGNMIPIYNDFVPFMELNVNTNGVDGVGEFHFWVYETGDLSTAQDMYFTITTDLNGVAEVDWSQVEFYPNPAHENVYLHVPSNATFELHSLDGTRVRSGNQRQFDVGDLPPGMYLLTIWLHAERKTYRLIIQ